jgi:hypothetical protein
VEIALLARKDETSRVVLALRDAIVQGCDGAFVPCEMLAVAGNT